MRHNKALAACLIFVHSVNFLVVPVCFRLSVPVRQGGFPQGLLMEVIECNR